MKKMNFYKCGRTALALGLAGTMLFTRPMQVSAVRSISEIQEEQSSIQSELNGLDSDALAIWRILRCNPWGGSGYDPVP